MSLGRGSLWEERRHTARPLDISPCSFCHVISILLISPTGCRLRPLPLEESPSRHSGSSFESRGHQLQRVRFQASHLPSLHPSLLLCAMWVTRAPPPRTNVRAKRHNVCKVPLGALYVVSAQHTDSMMGRVTTTDAGTHGAHLLPAGRVSLLLLSPLPGHGLLVLQLPPESGLQGHFLFLFLAKRGS